MIKPLRLLVLEDSAIDFMILARHLDRAGFEAELHRVANEAELAAALGADWDAVLTDYRIPGMEFQETVALVLQRDPVVVQLARTPGHARCEQAHGCTHAERQNPCRTPPHDLVPRLAEGAALRAEA
jgi:CheY-like chemotaxis protein